MKNPKLQGASPKRKLWFGAAIWFGDDAHIKNLRPTFSRAGSDVQTLHCTSELCPQNTQNTQKKICVFLRFPRAKKSPRHIKSCEIAERSASATSRQ